MKKYDILTLGFPMVEIMRKERGIRFDEVGDFSGPYPSGDTCIVLDVAARMGKKCCFLGVAGDDGLSNVVLERLAADNVDVQYVRKVENYSTAVVFVRYEPDGRREYLDIVKHSACSQLNEEDVHCDAVKNAKWIHFSGEILSICKQGQYRKAMLKLLDMIPKDSYVCLDPNFTEDIVDIEDLMAPFIKRADVILPSEGEAKLLKGTETDEDACRLLASEGKLVVLKKGKSGCELYYGNTREWIPAFSVKEIDPTGCGDSFCAGLICSLLDGYEIKKAGYFANAVGALQATMFGPMEGATNKKEVEEFIKNSEMGGSYGN